MGNHSRWRRDFWFGNHVHSKVRGFDVVTCEGSLQVGGIWKLNWSNFSVQVPCMLFEFLDFPMHQIGSDDHATGVQVQEGMEALAKEFELLDSIQFDTCLDKV